MQILLAVLGYVLLSILFVLCAIVILLFVPVKLHTKYEHTKFTVKIKILFFTLKLYPMTKKEKKQVKQIEQTGEKKVKKQAKKVNISLFAEDIVEIIILATGAIKKIMHSMKFSKVCLTIPVHKQDVAQTAIDYGKMNAYISGAYGALNNILRIDVEDINIICDYDNAYKEKTYFYCKISAMPIALITVLIYTVIKLKQNNVF